MLSEREIKDFVRRQDEGDIEKCYGPSELGSSHVWEFWVYNDDDDEYYTRYVIDTPTENPKYFSEFQQFCVHANGMLTAHQEKITELQTRVKNAAHRNRQDTIRLYVGFFVFIACAITLLVLIITNKAESGWSIVLLWGLIASGGLATYGKWIQPQLPRT